jgi:predicted nucleic acid-binding protein
MPKIARRTVNYRGLADPLPGLVGDASAVINVLASGAAGALTKSLSAPLRVVSAVNSELANGKKRWSSADQLSALVAAGSVEIVELDKAALECFESLVIGPAVDTLDDGEAATIAYAVATGTVALIDEKKGRRICGSRFPELVVHTTVDLLTSAHVVRILGQDALAEAIFKALHAGRMRVPATDYERVMTIIGMERAKLCASLPDHIRFPSRNWPVTRSRVVQHEDP